MSAPSHGWIGRRGYSLAAAGLAAFIAYGSLVPLDFHPLPFSVALARFTAGLTYSIHIDSNTDFATNVLLGLPLGYLTLAALCSDRRRSFGTIIAALFAVAVCGAVALGVEFAQTFFPGRTPSYSDIVAQIIGGGFGAALWMVVGEMVTGWLRHVAAERQRAALAQQLLLGYCVLFLISQLMPLDLTLSLGELAQKYRNGAIILRPFSYQHPSAFDMIWDYSADIVLNAPIGAAAMLLWPPARGRRSIGVALFMSLCVVGAVELAQVFVSSRYADITDVITGTVGAAIGVFIVRGFAAVALSDVPRRDVSRAIWMARVAAAFWLVALIAYHCSPFDFTLEPQRVAFGMRQLLLAPFSSYYLGSPLHAFTEMMRKALLALPLGVLARLSLHGSLRHASRARILALQLGGLIVLGAMETSQVFLPSRTPDITDAFIGEIGFIAGIWLTGWFASIGRVEAPVLSPDGAAQRLQQR